nr:hypothetical protein [Gemmatimonadaceae bacterium]
MRTLLLLCAVPSLVMAQVTATPSAAPTSPRAMTLADWYRVTQVSGAQLSPDGRRVAFTVTTVRESENKRHS